ncbi:MAG TPA: LLM class flavin-dependent oxidoreductase [Nannocystaceae bacterium]|nr:LLM class flavin-dependent oxidoreductase [Nannocystaceae bacterium]
MAELSILDLVPIRAGGTAGDALTHSLTLARDAERLGYRRYWVAEHHNMPGIASAATAVVIGMLAGGTKTLTIGAGGIMLPNHSPLVVAEQFGTLASLYPGRIELGLGRAPGTDPFTARALRRDAARAEAFDAEVLELQSYLAPARPGQRVNAVPGVGTEVPLWILGSSLYGAQLAANLGLPFSFASHFAPAQLEDAIRLYRDRFRPSATLQHPYVMLGVNVVAAATDAKAHRLFTSVQQLFANLVRGKPGAVPPPIDDIDAYWTEIEKAQASHMLARAIVGEAAAVRERLALFAESTGADELIVVTTTHDPEARRESYELIAPQ